MSKIILFFVFFLLLNFTCAEEIFSWNDIPLSSYRSNFDLEKYQQEEKINEFHSFIDKKNGNILDICGREFVSENCSNFFLLNYMKEGFIGFNLKIKLII